MKPKEFDRIFDECVEAILSGKATAAECLHRHPEQAAELKPLLETVAQVNEAVSMTPRTAFRETARQEFQTAIRDMDRGKQPARWFPVWRPQWAVVPISLLVLFLVGGGTVAAASGSMPDQPLYPVKLATETVRVTLTPSDIGKAELYATLVDERIDEIERMAEEGKTDKVEATTRLLSEQLVAMSELATASVAVTMLAPSPVPAAAPAPEPAPAPALTEEAPRAMKALSEPVIEAPQEPAYEAPRKQAAPPETEAPRMAQRQGPGPAVEIAPEPAGRPGVTIQSPGTPESQAPLTAESSGEDESRSDREKADREARLRAQLAEKAAANRERLQEVLQKAPGDVRSSVEKAVEVTEDGYRRALESWDNKGRD
ncbi:MAG: DUF5667 domain-containing protein [Chloroflexota bacterium]